MRARSGAAVKHAAVLRKLAHLAAMAQFHQARFVQLFVRFRQRLAARVAAANQLAGVVRTLAAVQRLARIKLAVRRFQARPRARRAARVYAKRPELRAIAERAAKARAAALANPALWLCNRTNVALETLLTSKVMGEVLRAVSSLEMFTLIAPNVCERMVAEGAVPVLFHFLSTSNRSVPSQKMVGHGLRALLNIAKLPNLREALCAQAESTNCLAVLVELAQGYYRDKAHHAHLWDVLALLAELLLRGPADWRKRVLSRKDGAECVKRLESVLALLSRAALKEGGANQARGAAGAGAAAAKKGGGGGQGRRGRGARAQVHRVPQGHPVGGGGERQVRRRTQHAVGG